jgi:phosphoserine phosphatase
MIQAFPRYLAGRRKMSEAFPNEIDAVVAAYLNGTTSYVEVAKKVARLYAAGIKGLKVVTVKKLAEEFMGTYFTKNVFNYSKRLVRDSRKLVGLTIAISGSPQEVVSEVGGFLPFDEIHGSLFTTKAGVYTGMVKRNLILGGPKGDLIDEVSRHLMIDLSKSLAFGDTDQDGPALKKVGHPIAMNPNRSLLKLCVRNHWPWYTEGNPPRLAQIYPGASRNNIASDDQKSREKYFLDCLEKISKIKDINSIAFPWRIGCGLAGGNWDTYMSMIDNFSSKFNINVSIYKNTRCTK